MPGVAGSVPHCAHGWLSDDTKVLLSAAIAACKPRALLELGAWYGLSSRHIMTQAAAEGISGMQFYSVDYFKNNAHYDRWVVVVKGEGSTWTQTWCKHKGGWGGFEVLRAWGMTILFVWGMTMGIGLAGMKR